MADEQFTIEVLVKQAVAKEFKKIEDRLKELESGFEKLKTGEKVFSSVGSAAKSFSGSLRTAGSSADALVEAQLRLRRAQNDYKASLRELNAETDKGSENYRRLRNELKSSAIELERAKQVLRDTNRAYREANLSNKTFIDRLIDQQRHLLGFSKRLDIAIQKIITYRIAFGIFREVTEAIRDTFDEVINLDNAFGDLQKVLRTTEDELNVLRSTAFNLGKEFGRSADEIVSGFKTFAQQGLDTEGIIDRTRVLLLAVSATTLDTKGAIEALTAASTIFGDEFEDLTRVVDKWLAVEREVPVQAADFADALKGLGFIAKELGIDLDELNAIVAAVGEGTRKSGRAIANSFRTILARATSEEAIEAFQELNVQVLNTEREFRPFGDVIRDLGNRWSTLTQQQRLNIAVVLGQRRRYTDFLALMDNYDRFLQSTTTSQNALGDAQIAAGVETEKLSRRLESVNTTLSELKEAVGTEIVTELVELAEGFRNVIENVTANASSVVNLINVNLKVVATIISINIVVRTFAGLLTAAGRAAKIAAIGTGAFAKSAIRASLAIRSLQGIFVPLIGIIFLVYDAFQLLKVSSDDSVDSQKEFQKIMEENQVAARNSARELAILNETLNEFERNQSIREKNRSIDLLEQQIIETTNRLNILRRDQDNLIKEQERATSVKGLLQIAAGDESAVARLAKVSEELKKLPKEIRNTEENIVKAEASIVTLQAQLRKLSGQEALPKDLNALQIAEIEVNLNRLNSALEKVEPGRDFRGIDAGEFKIRSFKGVQIDKAGADALREKINREINRLLSLKEDLVIGKNIVLDVSGIEGADRAQVLSKVQERVIILENSLNSLDSTLLRNARTAALFGESFSDPERRLETFRKSFQELDNQILELQGKRKVIEENLRVDTEGTQLASKELKKLKEEEKQVNEAINLLLQKRTDLEDIYGNKIKQTVRDVIRLKSQQEELNTDIVRQNTAYDTQIEILRGISSSLTGVSRSRLLDRTTLERQLSLEKQILKLELERELSAIKLQLAVIGEAQDKDSVIKKNNLIQKQEQARIRNAQQLKLLNVRTIENLNREVSAIQNQITSNIAASLAQLPSSISNRAQAEEDLGIRRKEIEFELQKARESGDQAAINSARHNLLLLEQDARRLGSVFEDVFLGIAESIASVRFQRISEQLVDSLANTGDVGRNLSNAISGNAEESIRSLTTELNEGIVSGGGILSGAILTASTEATKQAVDGQGLADKRTSDTIVSSHRQGASQLSTALEASFTIGASLLAASLFGGGRGAQAGSTVGGLFGQAAGAKFIGGTFGGPLGILAGSLLGAGIFSLFDNKREFIEPFDTLGSKLDRNSEILNNTNKLLELERSFINVPSQFTPNALQTQGAFSGGISGPINVNVYTDGNTTDGRVIGKDVADAIEERFVGSVRRSRSTAPTFG